MWKSKVLTLFFLVSLYSICQAQNKGYVSITLEADNLFSESELVSLQTQISVNTSDLRLVQSYSAENSIRLIRAGNYFRVKIPIDINKLKSIQATPSFKISSECSNCKINQTTFPVKYTNTSTIEFYSKVVKVSKPADTPKQSEIPPAFLNEILNELRNNGDIANLNNTTVLAILDKITESLKDGSEKQAGVYAMLLRIQNDLLKANDRTVLNDALKDISEKSKNPDIVTVADFSPHDIRKWNDVFSKADKQTLLIVMITSLYYQDYATAYIVSHVYGDADYEKELKDVCNYSLPLNKFPDKPTNIFAYIQLRELIENTTFFTNNLNLKNENLNLLLENKIISLCKQMFVLLQDIIPTKGNNTLNKDRVRIAGVKKIISAVDNDIEFLGTWFSSDPITHRNNAGYALFAKYSDNFIADGEYEMKECTNIKSLWNYINAACAAVVTRYYYQADPAFRNRFKQYIPDIKTYAIRYISSCNPQSNIIQLFNQN